MQDLNQSAAQKPVLMECLVRREGGSQVHLGDLIYHFTPDKRGRHVALMLEASHIAMLDAVPEAYVNHGPIEADVPATAEIAPAARMALGLAKQENATVAQESGPSLTELMAQMSVKPVDAVPLSTGATTEPVSSTHAGQATIVAPPASAQTGAGVAGSELPKVGDCETASPEQIAQVRAIFECELGRKPHHKANFETMVAQIEASRIERATSTGA